MNTAHRLATDFGHGSQHDFQLFQDSRTGLTRQPRALADAGYQRLADRPPNRNTPAKKSKFHPLSADQKASQRALSRERILIEHLIRRLKIFRILSERYRNRRKRFGLRFNLIAAIYNLEIYHAG